MIEARIELGIVTIEKGKKKKEQIILIWTPILILMM
jgi:hypothetical protein